MPIKQSSVVKFIVAASLLIIVAAIAFAEHGIARDTALVRGQARNLDQSIGMLLRSRRDSTRYLIFDRAAADAALIDARVRVRGEAVLSDVVVSADSGRAYWTTGARNGTRWALGLVVKVRGRLTAPATGTTTSDTLEIVLPGLRPLAIEYGDTPMFARGRYSHLAPGDSGTVATFTVYPSASAAKWAADRWAYLGVAALVALVLVLVSGVTALIKAR